MKNSRTYPSFSSSLVFEKMGRATRWFKSLLGLRKEKDCNKEASRVSNVGEKVAVQPPLVGKDSKKRWSFGKSVRDSRSTYHSGSVSQIPASEQEWMRSYYNETEEKAQKNHAIAVAAATSKAAVAALVAADAACAVVRLTSQGRGTMFNGGREKWAAEAACKIQAVFRGYLARKALTALKALVKLQAVVRGYLVRKQTSETLCSMQALIRAQNTIRVQKIRGHVQRDQRPPRKSLERHEDIKNEHSVAIHSRRLSATFQLDECAKIVEIDTVRPKSRSKRTNTSDSGEEAQYQHISSPLPLPKPSRLSIPDSRIYQDCNDWGYNGDECRFSTAQSTPRFKNLNECVTPVTPAKTVCGYGYGYADNPNYMSNTKSFRAKLRSHSAPKQRPEPSPRKRLSLNDIVESRASLSGVRMQRSCSQAQDAVIFKNAVRGKIDKSAEFGREAEREYLQRKW